MRTLVLVGLSTLLTSELAHAGASPEHIFPDEALLRDWRRDVYVVTIKSVDEKGATHAKPPRVVLVIKEALRGEFKPGAEVEALWHPMPHSIDTTGREKELEAWKSKPLSGPKVGENLI